MPDVPRVGDMELHQDLSFQRAEWVFERVGWAVLVFLLAAALLGLLGGGPLSGASAQAPDGSLDIEYERFLRYHAPTTLQVHVAPGAAEGGVLRLWLDRDYLDALEVKEVVPAPDRVVVGEGTVTYHLRVADPSRPVLVTFRLEADRAGSVAGRAGVAGRGAAEFSHFVYP
jgi:hypothetical protein